MKFKFGQQVVQSIGIVNIRLSQDEQSHITLNIHVVDLNIPLIIGLDVIKSHSLLLNYVENRLEFRNLSESKPLTYKHGHVFIEWDQKAIMYSREELTGLHLHFIHPGVDRLLELIKRANPDSATKSVKELLHEISSACQTYREFRSKQLRFKASISPNELVFNQSIYIHLLWFDEQPVLHVIDDHTSFRNAAFIRSNSASDIWSAFVACWASNYIGFPGQIRSDQKSGVSSNLFRDLATAHGIELEFSRVASHNSILTFLYLLIL